MRARGLNHTMCGLGLASRDKLNWASTSITSCQIMRGLRARMTQIQEKHYILLDLVKSNKSCAARDTRDNCYFASIRQYPYSCNVIPKQ